MDAFRTIIIKWKNGRFNIKKRFKMERFDGCLCVDSTLD